MWRETSNQSYCQRRIFISGIYNGCCIFYGRCHVRITTGRFPVLKSIFYLRALNDIFDQSDISEYCVISEPFRIFTTAECKHTKWKISLGNSCLISYSSLRLLMSIVVHFKHRNDPVYFHGKEIQSVFKMLNLAFVNKRFMETCKHTLCEQ